MLHVLLETPSPRARYVVRHVFERMLGWGVTFVVSREELRSAEGPRISYGQLPMDDVFHVPASGWLDRPCSTNATIGSSATGRELVLFPIGPSFDVFAAIFHLIALEEEYTITGRDEHDRVSVDEMLLVRSRACEFPIVDLWAMELAERIRAAFPSLPVPHRTYRHVLTVDVDNGLKYAARSWHRAMGASAKELASGKTARFIERWRVRSGRNEDPYMSFATPLQGSDGRSRRMSLALRRANSRASCSPRLREEPVMRTT